MTLDVPTLNPCPFCEYLGGARPAAFVLRGRTVSSFLNRAQYERGALLVVPNIHVESIFDLSPSLAAELYGEAHRVARALVHTLGASGLNIFQNNGASAGQTVPHFHVHVIPRYGAANPNRRFHEGDFPQTPHEELEPLAATLRRGLEQLSFYGSTS